MQRRTLTIVLLLVPFVGIGLLLSVKQAQGNGVSAGSLYKGEWWGADSTAGSSSGYTYGNPSWGASEVGESRMSSASYGGGGTTMENAFVHIGREGRFEGRETKFLRGIPGYCKSSYIQSQRRGQSAGGSDRRELELITGPSHARRLSHVREPLHVGRSHE